MLRTTVSAALVSALLPTAGLAPKSSDPFERWTPGDRVELVVLHRPEAERQSTFTFLQRGLTLDGAGRAQSSHLVEHLLVRSTDPDSLASDGVQVNGETTASLLRVETHAEQERWREALARHAAWLRVDAVDAEVLEREKGRIAEEELNTVAAGFTHKWAEAAWAQVVRHGRAHAAVHGDVQGASVEQALAEIATALRDARVVIASVGPVDPEELRVETVRLFGDLGSGDASHAREATGSRLVASRDTATWDLAAHHYLEWIALPDDGPVDRVAAQAAAQLTTVALASAAGLEPGRALASVLDVPEGRYLLLSASLGDAEAVAGVRESFDAALERASRGAGMGLDLALFQLRAASGAALDAEPMKRQLRAMGRDTSLVEAQLCLTAISTELSLGLDREEQTLAWKELDADRLRALLEELAGTEDRGRLLLRPR